MIRNPLSKEQVEAASKLHDIATSWNLSDGAFSALLKMFPTHSDPKWVLAKCAAINALYGAGATQLQLYSISMCITEVINHKSKPLQLELVEDILSTHKKRFNGSRLIVLVSKYCNFFVDEQIFPIYDRVTRLRLQWHLEGNYDPKGETIRSYAQWHNDIRKLLSEPSLESISLRELDRYLWLGGELAIHTGKCFAGDLAVNPGLKQELFDKISVDESIRLLMMAAYPDLLAS